MAAQFLKLAENCVMFACTSVQDGGPISVKLYDILQVLWRVVLSLA